MLDATWKILYKDYFKNITRQEAWECFLQFKKSKCGDFLDKKGAHHEGIIPQRNEKSSSVFQERSANFQTITFTMKLSDWLK